LVPSLRDVEYALKQECRLAKVAIEDSLTPTLAQKAAPFALTLATPHTVINVIVECVDQTRSRHGAGSADSLGDDDARSIAGEEDFRGVLAALSIGHPFGCHIDLLFLYFSHSSHIATSQPPLPLQRLYNSFTNEWECFLTCESP
jgi:hypothetical protein